MRPSRGQLRAGLTLIELIFTIVLIGIVSAIAVPRLHTLKDQAQLSGATTRFSRAVMTARQAAIESFAAAGDGQRTMEVFEILHFAAWNGAPLQNSDHG